MERNFGANNSMSNIQYYKIVSFKGFSGMKKGFKSMAVKWKEVLGSQKEAPIFSKWSERDEINLLNSPHSQIIFRHSTQESSLDHKETGQ